MQLLASRECGRPPIDEQKVNDSPRSDHAPPVDERVGAMRGSAFFQDVPQRELEAIAARLTLRRFDQGAPIVTEGNEGDACYLMRKGEAVVVSPDVVGHEVRLATLGPGTLFGETALVRAGRRSATVRALRPVEAYVLRRADFHRRAARLSPLVLLATA